MDCHKIKRTDTQLFSDIANDLVYRQTELESFIQQPFSLDNFQQQIELKQENYALSTRKVLVEEWRKQYRSISDEKIQQQLNLLGKPTTFTVTTGHQLNLYTGPLYFIYKILHVVKLTEQLKSKYPTFDFVPVYWMASEDHDFEEINHFRLFNQDVKWETNQSGAVGRFVIKEFEEVRAQIKEKFQNDADFADWMFSFYTDGKTLAQATFELVHELLGKYGVLILDADRAALKELFLPVMEKEVNTHFSSQAVEKTNAELIDKGYKTQVHPRAINLFYLTENSRDRIIYTESGDIQIGDEHFTVSEVIEKMKLAPQDFSPNVVLRPVYQECILPNLCYVGGGGEAAYWLQLKGVFDAVNMVYPLLQVRNSIQLIDKVSYSKITKLGLTLADVFSEREKVKKKQVLDNASERLDFSKIESTAKELAEKMEALIEEVDKGLDGFAKSESVKVFKQVEVIKQKLIRHEKKKQENTMNQIDSIWKKLYPNNSLQERKENVFEWLSKSGKNCIDQWYTHIDPQEQDLIVLIERD